MSIHPGGAPGTMPRHSIRAPMDLRLLGRGRRRPVLAPAAPEQLARFESLDAGKPLRQSRVGVGWPRGTSVPTPASPRGSSGRRSPPRSAPVRTRPARITALPATSSRGTAAPGQWPIRRPSAGVGNCRVLKPAEEASLAPPWLGELALEAGEPGDQACRGHPLEGGALSEWLARSANGDERGMMDGARVRVAVGHDVGCRVRRAREQLLSR
jgi:hypothetical protein